MKWINCHKHTHTHRTRARAREMYVWKIVCRDADLNRLMCVYVRVSIWRKSVQYKPKYRIAVFVHAEDTPIHLTHGSPAVLLNAYTHTHTKQWTTDEQNEHTSPLAASFTYRTSCMPSICLCFFSVHSFSVQLKHFYVGINAISSIKRRTIWNCSDWRMLFSMIYFENYTGGKILSQQVFFYLCLLLLK